MALDADHGAQVSAWLERVGEDLTPDHFLDVFESGFGALWTRSHRTLGAVTIAAIVDRVLYTSAERFPILASLELDAAGLTTRKLREGGDLTSDQLSRAICFLMVEFLTVLGNLTGDILTPALHAELAAVATTGRRAEEPQGTPATPTARWARQQKS